MPPKKRVRSATKVDVAPLNIFDGEDEVPPAKKSRGKAKPQAVVVSDEEEESTPAKKPRGKAAATTTAKAKAKAVPKKSKGKQKVDDAQGTQAGAGPEDEEPSTQNGGKKIDDLFQSPVKKQHNDAQIARTANLAIPVDEGCPYASTYRVYIDTDGTIWDASLNQTNVGANNNKFYRIQLLESRSGGNFVVWTRWGRVGERGQSKAIDAYGLDGAKTQFSSKFKDKSGLTWENRSQPPILGKKKYTFIERSYEADSSEDENKDKDDLPGAGSRRGSKQSTMSEVPSQLALPVQHLMELIFSAKYFKEVMADMNYNPEKLPLGKLSKRTLEQGYGYLKQLADLILGPTASSNPAASGSTADLTSAYFSTIPHDFGRNKPQAITNEQQLKREIELLESLSDMKIAEDIMKQAKANTDTTIHPLDRQYNGLGISEMTALDFKSSEFQELEAYLQMTKGDTHNLTYKVEDIFRIERDGEFERFETSGFGKMNKDRRLLWHGSRTTNFGGILSQGLRIAPPEAPVSGYMFGKGVYLADMSSKSANYCWADSSGNVALLLLCEAELGKPLLQLINADYDAESKVKEAGRYSTWGQGRMGPLKWKDAGAVHENLKGVRMPDVSVKPGNSNVKNASLYYNEYIVYDVSQIRLRYLFRVNMTSSYPY